MDHPSEMQEIMDAAANLAAMQRAAKRRLDEKTFTMHPTRTGSEHVEPAQPVGKD